MKEEAEVHGSYESVAFCRDSPKLLPKLFGNPGRLPGTRLLDPFQKLAAPEAVTVRGLLGQSGRDLLERCEIQSVQMQFRFRQRFPRGVHDACPENLFGGWTRRECQGRLLQRPQ